MKRLLLIFSFIFLSTRLTPCSCVNFKSFYWHYNLASTVFKGKVIAIIEPTDPKSYERKVIFKISDQYKGQFASDTILLKTGSGRGDCGLPVSIDDVWIIFSSERQASVCNANVKLNGNDKYIMGHPFGLYDSKWIESNLQEVSKGVNKYIKEYNSKKQLIAEGQLTNKLAEGFWKYHRDYNVGNPGMTDEKIFYKNGIKDSLEFEYYNNKKLYIERHWKNGELNGKETYYHPNGKIDMSRNYINGKKDGEWKMFYENGSLRQFEKYSKDVPLGIHVDYFENGDTNVVDYYENGKRTKCWAKYSNGNFNFIWDYEYKDTTCFEKSVGYFENGKVRYSGKSINNKSDGEQLLYYENGNLKEKKYYSMSVPTGTWLYYDENGTLIKEEKK